MGAVFDLVLINPLTNLLVLLTHVFLGNVGIAIIAITVLVRLGTLPLTLKQLQSTRAMAVIAPRIQEVQKRYKDPKRRQEETMKVYREAGVSPVGCFSSMLVQMPILIALYSTLRIALGASPEALVDLSDRLYPWQYLRGAVPVNDSFLWLNLGRSDQFLLPLLVGMTTYIVQKMSSLPPTDERQAAQASMMNIMMPLMFGYFTILVPSGLGLYYVLSNLVQMALQYFYVGGGPFNWRALVGLSQEPVLPRALEARKAEVEARQRAAQNRAGESGEREPAAAHPGSANRRRRRYASGRRRGRR
jgi:YidC/Oxa1 family membrane protein insertase